MSDAIWLDVLPSLAGFAPALVRETAAASTNAGRTAGQAWSDAMQGSGTGGAASLVAELEAASKASAATVGKLANTVGTARAAERAAAANLILAEQKLIDVREKYGEESAQAQAAEIRLESAREKATASATRYTAAEDQLKAAQRERREITSQLETATTDLANGTGDLSDEVSGQRSLWDRLRGDLGGAEDDVDSLGGSVLGLVAQLGAAATAAATFGAGWSNALDLDVGVSKLSASMLLTEVESERAGTAAGSLYSQAYGESMEDITSSVSTVMSTISGMRDASTADLESVTGAAMTFAEVFDMDVADAATTASIAIRNGFATDATSALDLVAAALSKTPELMRGDVMDAANEYGVYMTGLGLTGEQAFSMLANASAGGTIAVDKVGDAMKELSVRVGGDVTAMEPYFEQLGLNATDMSTALLAGGTQGQEALSQIVTGLESITDPSQQAQAALGLFGTPLEDLGLTEIPAFLASLSAMDNTLGDTTGTIGLMSDALNDNAASSLESLKRGFMGAVTEGIEPLLEPAQKVLDWVKEIPGGFEAAAVGIGALGIGVAAYTVAQWAMNTAMFASPIFWIVAAVGLLVAAVVLAVENWDTIVAWIGDTWDSFTAWFSESLPKVGEWFSDLWEGILDFIVEWGPRFLIAIGGPFVWLAAWLVTNWDEIRATAIGAWESLLDWFGGVGDWVLDKLASLGDLAGKMGEWVGDAKDAAIGKFEDLIEWVAGLGASVVSKLGNMKTLLKDAGKQIIEGFLGGLKDKFEDVKDWVGGVGSWIADHKGPRAYDLGLLVPAGGWIMTGLQDGLEAEIPALEKTLAKVTNAIKIPGNLSVAVQSASAMSSSAALAMSAGTSSSVDTSRNTTINVGGITTSGPTAQEIMREISWLDRTMSL